MDYDFKEFIMLLRVQFNVSIVKQGITSREQPS
jgi:hypothetical protein